MTSPIRRSEAIKNFLTARTHSDLASLYNPAMECTVIVDHDNGTRIEGTYEGKSWSGWTDGLTTWKNFWIPGTASTHPIDNDGLIRFDLAEHALGIGMTGWDWKNKYSRWVGFDFDAIVGHSEKHGSRLSKDELLDVEQAARELPWVTVRRSTSGKGIHLYIFLHPVYTINHTEHAALARSILAKMSYEIGFDFQARVDAQGGNMWVWHRKMLGTNGLEIIKEGNILTDIPSNWMDHLDVVTNKRRKVILPNFEPISEDEQKFEEVCGQVNKVNLDEEHKKLIDWLSNNGHACVWNSDYHMLITHTSSLAQAHVALDLKGVFKTIAEGREQGDHNCFAYPMPDGAWAIRRYSLGCVEAATWDQDRSGYTRCVYNRIPDLNTVARYNAAPESQTGGYIFQDGATARQALEQMNVFLDIPNSAWSQPVKVKEHKTGRMILQIDDAREHSPQEMAQKGFVKEGKKWNKILNALAQPVAATDVTSHDDIIRHLVTDSHLDAGWVFNSDLSWRAEPLAHVKIALKSIGVLGSQLDELLGNAIRKPWTLVVRPFQPEYPGDRHWNRQAPQLRYAPTSDLDSLTYPHWSMILNHVGRGLNRAVEINSWCRQHGIKTGADYLKVWIASVFQFPLEPLPYLFLFSEEQATGKSIFHEALELLVNRGVIRADTALISPSGFNAELENAIICVIEETNLRQNKEAKNRIKDWVTSRSVTIHRKGQTPYQIDNSLHFIQCSNEEDACPIPTGDTRIVVVRVPPLEKPIPKRTLIQALQKEASDFLASILTYEIPESNDRLNLPVIETEFKSRLTDIGKDEVKKFIDECTFDVDGEMISIKELWDKFLEYLDPMDINSWTKRKMVAKVPTKYPKGRCPKTAQWHFGNISFVKKPDGNYRYSLKGETLELIRK